ncbi:hypothetical protein D3C76_1786030 [compost metagenome]
MGFPPCWLVGGGLRVHQFVEGGVDRLGKVLGHGLGEAWRVRRAKGQCGGLAVEAAGPMGLGV